MDLYACGSTLRLSQSYADQAGLLSTAFIYDNALTIIAYLKRPGGIARQSFWAIASSMLKNMIHLRMVAYVRHILPIRLFIQTGPSIWSEIPSISRGAP